MTNTSGSGTPQRYGFWGITPTECKFSLEGDRLHLLPSKIQFFSWRSGLSWLGTTYPNGAKCFGTGHRLLSVGSCGLKEMTGYSMTTACRCSTFQIRLSLLFHQNCISPLSFDIPFYVWMFEWDAFVLLKPLGDMYFSCIFPRQLIKFILSIKIQFFLWRAAVRKFQTMDNSSLRGFYLPNIYAIKVGNPFLNSWFISLYDGGLECYDSDVQPKLVYAPNIDGLLHGECKRRGYTEWCLLQCWVIWNSWRIASLIQLYQLLLAY